MDPKAELPLPDVVAAPAELVNESRDSASHENPCWGAIDLVIGSCAFLFALFISTSFFVSIGAHASHVPYSDMVKSPTALIVIPAMILAYVALLATLYLRVAGSESRSFWAAVSWRWPSGSRWLAFLAIGAAMAVLFPLLSRLLPIPKAVPLDRFFRDARAAYLMMFMGVAIAPFAEEITFRGFIYPLLDRWLQTSLISRRQLARGSVWLALMAGWGYLVHRVGALGPGPAMALSVLLAMFAIVPVAFLSFACWLKGKPASPILVPGLGLCVWGLAARSLSAHALLVATTAFVALAVVLAAVAAMGGLPHYSAGRIGRAFAILVTSGMFAMVHSEQLGAAWGPLLIIFSVGLVLTITRVVSRSVAPGYLIHVGYNFVLFCTVYVGTDHFRHLERLSQ